VKSTGQIPAKLTKLCKDGDVSSSCKINSARRGWLIAFFASSLLAAILRPSETHIHFDGTDQVVHTHSESQPDNAEHKETKNFPNSTDSNESDSNDSSHHDDEHWHAPSMTPFVILKVDFSINPIPTAASKPVFIDTSPHLRQIQSRIFRPPCFA